MKNIPFAFALFTIAAYLVLAAFVIGLLVS
jgi:hypothetical protein